MQQLEGEKAKKKRSIKTDTGTLLVPPQRRKHYLQTKEANQENKANESSSVPKESNEQDRDRQRVLELKQQKRRIEYLKKKEDRKIAKFVGVEVDCDTSSGDDDDGVDLERQHDLKLRQQERRNNYLKNKQERKMAEVAGVEVDCDASSDEGDDGVDLERQRDLKLREQEHRNNYLKSKQERKVVEAGVGVVVARDDEDEFEVEPETVGTSTAPASFPSEDIVEDALTQHGLGASPPVPPPQLDSQEDDYPAPQPGAYRFGSDGRIRTEGSDIEDGEDSSVTSPSPSPGHLSTMEREMASFVNTNVVATLVEEDDTPIVTAESVRAEGFFLQDKPKTVTTLAILFCVVLGLGVGLGVVLPGKMDSSPPKETSFALALDPIDGERDSKFGASVSMCKDGSRFAVASPGIGQVQVFELDGQGGHIQLGQNFTFDPSVIGSSRHVKTGIVVELSADCGVLGIGLPYQENKETGEQTGRVELFQYDAKVDSWEELGVPNSIPGVMVGDFAGSCLSLSRDGGLVAIGSPGHAQNGEFSGQVRVFKLAQREGNWAQLGSPIYGDVPDESFGFSVSLSIEDGSNVMAVGGTTPPGTSIAAATVFRFQTGEWVQRGSAILPDPQSLVGIETAWIVRLSKDGTKLVISNIFLGEDGDEKVASVPDNRALYVAAYEFNMISNDWTRLGGNLHSMEMEGPKKSGYTVALSDDGTRIAMGDPGSGDAGTLSGLAHIYDYSEGRWCQLGENIVGYASGDLAGFSVSLSGDGNRILVGSPLNRALSGTERGRIWMKDVLEDAKVTWCEEA